MPSNNEQVSKICKLIIIGDSSVGKTSLLKRYVKNEFSNNMLSTIGIDFLIRSYKHKDETYKIQMWDTAGQEKFLSITSAYYRGADLVIVTYDITRPNALARTEFWLEQLNCFGRDATPVAVVGNKSDLLEEPASYNKAVETYCQERGLQHYVTSALTGFNVNNLFSGEVEAIIQERYNQSHSQENPSISLEGISSTIASYCCN